jgi:fluoride ion exporter CrcB/FEX
MLNGILIVAAGAIIGAVARFLITHISSELSHHHGFPYGTLVVHVVGCVIVGASRPRLQNLADNSQKPVSWIASGWPTTLPELLKGLPPAIGKVI